MTNSTIVEYIWIDKQIQSKTRVIYEIVYDLFDIPNLTINRLGDEIIIKPIKLFKCPFRKSPNLIVLCDTYTSSMVPLNNNYRYDAIIVFDKYINQNPWFSFEQEYDANVDAAEEHLQACLYAEIKISSSDSKMFGVGPLEGIDAADQLWMARFIMEKIAKQHRITINWLGLCSIKFSTELMRATNGLNIILSSIEKLHNIDQISNCGIGNYNQPIRIPQLVINDKSGYFEDRRPIADSNPYQTTANLLEITMK